MIAIIGAMPEEVSALRLHFDDLTESILESKQIYYNDTLVIAQSGVGKVEAAYTTQLLINKFSPKLVINIGSAGGLKADQNVGDIVIANKLSYHDFILDISQPYGGGERYTFEADKILVNQAKEICETLQLNFHIGWGVSGDQFVYRQSQVDFIKEYFDEALFCEMEACAVAHVCNRANVSWIILRGLSDIVVEEGNELSFEQYLAQAAKVSAQICTEFINKYE